MDPFTFGIVFVGASGGALFVLHALEESGLSINSGMVRIFMEVTKYGAILWLLKVCSKVFF